MDSVAVRACATLQSVEWLEDSCVDVSYLACRRRFEDMRTLRDAVAIDDAIRAGHNQVDVALHYKICYPRPQYVDPGTMGGETDFRRQSSRSNTRRGRLHKSKVQSEFRPDGR